MSDSHDLPTRARNPERNERPLDFVLLDRVVRRWLASALVCLLAVVMLGADGSSDPSARFGRIGHNMICVCSCGQVLLECNHVGCPDSARMINELQTQLAGPSGTGADSLILNWFVNKYGASVLAAPIRGGFDNVAWIVPIAIFLLGTVGTALLVRLWTQKQRPALAGATGSQAPASLSSNSPSAKALRERIRRETEY